MWMATVLLVLLVLLASPAAGAGVGPGSAWIYPVDGGLSGVIRPFERPVDRFGPGHRGVDLQVAAGQEVRSIGDGVVTFVGEVAGTRSVTIDHGPVRSSYLPVTAEVTLGQSVRAGEVIGTIEAGHCLNTCLHLGLRRPIWDRLDRETDPYVDPIAWISRIPVLKPLDGFGSAS
jgi:murein DD-endopeptidase MepM/ murein hydrolase activator NlpD